VEGPGRGRSLPSPLLAAPSIKAHPPTASVPIVLLYNGLSLCGFNVPVKALNLQDIIRLQCGAGRGMLHIAVIVGK